MIDFEFHTENKVVEHEGVKYTFCELHIKAGCKEGLNIAVNLSESEVDALIETLREW